MTTVTEIITDAFRQGNLIAKGASPTTAEATEGLRYLNRLVKSVFGHEVGEPLTAFPVGRENIVRPSGFPGYDSVPSGDWYVPKNSRLVFNLAESVNLYLHPTPCDGSRFAVTDPGGSLSTYPVTIYGNGKTVEDATSITLNTDGLDREWFYRDDLANWVRSAPLLADDTFPFPEEFDDFFITMLAIRINPSYGKELDPQSKAVLDRSASQLKARYSQVIPVGSEPALIRMSLMTADRSNWNAIDSWYDDNTLFNTGYPY